MVALNTWLVREAAVALARWLPGRRRDDGVRFVSVPVDGRFVAHDAFLATVKDAVRDAGITPHNLLLTVDGRLSFDRLWSKLQRLKSHGTRVALDELGPGSHATDLLRRFAFDAVRMPISAAPMSETDDAELRATIKLAHHLSCEVIVDGVADGEQLDTLRWLGVDLAVGSRLGQPRPAIVGPPAAAAHLSDLARRPAG